MRKFDFYSKILPGMTTALRNLEWALALFLIITIGFLYLSQIELILAYILMINGDIVSILVLVI